MKTRKSGAKIFWFVIPVVMIIISFLYDNAIMAGTAKKYHMDSEAIIEEVMGNSFEESAMPEMIEKYYLDKGYEIDQLNARLEDGVLYVYNVHSYPSFFAQLFGVKSYRTEVNLKATVKNGKVKVEDIKGD